jgi:hypothetical protein
MLCSHSLIFNVSTCRKSIDVRIGTHEAFEERVVLHEKFNLKTPLIIPGLIDKSIPVLLGYAPYPATLGKITPGWPLDAEKLRWRE